MTTQEQNRAAAASPAAPTTGAATIAGGWRMLPGAAQILETDTEPTREEVDEGLPMGGITAEQAWDRAFSMPGFSSIQ